MKKNAALAMSLFVSTFAFAESGPGCGLGAQVFKGQSGLMSHVSAATTNGTSGNQTFGMSSGTLGCDTSETIKVASLYMEKNINRVAVDISQGKGESLNALAELLGVASEHKETFALVMKNNFDKIFVSSETTSQVAIENMLTLMQNHDILKQYAS